MKLRLICVGKLSESYLRTGVDDYASRIQRHLPLTTTELKEEKGGGPGHLREKEGERLLARVPPSAFTVVLDERGTPLSSEAFAALLERHMVRGTPEIALVLGGPYGLSDAVRARADLLLALSPMTFTHQMARLILLEQVYRALTILRNEPYHNR